MNAQSVRLADLAEVIRSKNAGPFEVTVDILFADDQAYERARRSPGLSPAAVAARYGIPATSVLDVLFYDPARAVKINLLRPVSSGTVGDRDVYGAQQYAPLLELELE